MNELTVLPLECVIEAFASHHGRLLILGEPGAGKTTSLLRLAEEGDIEYLQKAGRVFQAVVN